MIIAMFFIASHYDIIEISLLLSVQVSRIDYHYPKWWRWIIITMVDYYSVLLTTTDYRYWSLSCWLLLPFLLFIAVIHYFWLLVSLLSSLMSCIITSIIAIFFFEEEMWCFPISLEVDQDLSLGEELQEVGGRDDSAGRRTAFLVFSARRFDDLGRVETVAQFGV